MDNGKAVATGTKEQLKQIKDVTQADFSENRLTVHFIKGRHNLINLLGYLQNKDIPFGRVYSEPPTLNDVFLEITGKQLRD